MGKTKTKKVIYIFLKKVKYIGFDKIVVNFGKLYKLKLILKGYSDPGTCSCEIIIDERNILAKWDECPNPLENDDLNKFLPEKVPSTFFQPLNIEKEYTIPIVIKENESYYIFDGWWFGKDRGYYTHPALESSSKITIILRGNKFNWKKELTLAEIMNLAG